MPTIDEKRVYSDSTDSVGIYVGSSIGIVRVIVSDTLIGEFSLCERTPIQDIAAGPGTVAVAAENDVLVATPTDDPESFVETGFGPAVAVGYHGSLLIAAAADGRIARRHADTWETLGEPLEAEIRAIDGDLVGTDQGVYRLHDGDLVHAGLDDVTDISSDGVPLAATADGLYKLGNGWMERRSGAFDVVDADPASTPGTLERAHAVAGTTVYEHDDGTWSEYGWSNTDHGTDSSPNEPVVGIDYGDPMYAVTRNGTVFAVGTDEWRSRALGVTDVAGIAVPRPTENGD